MIRGIRGNGKVRGWLAVLAVMVLTVGLTVAAYGRWAAAAAPPTLDLKVLLIGDGSSDATTTAWQSALGSEGVPYTLVTASGTAPAQTLTLPALSSGSTGYYNGVIIADDPADFAS
ncbi:MAG: hypothetical protein JWM19_4169, partial [Actinomycetia bacterium]|nr:hypothetical protein [Actinomycetes bacterium]